MEGRGDLLPQSLLIIYRKMFALGGDEGEGESRATRRRARSAPATQTKLAARLTRVLLVLTALVVGLGTWVSWIEPSRLVVNRQELRLPGWPKELGGLRVAFLSDLHVGSPHWGIESLRALVTRVNEERPDLILLGGDYVIDDVPFGQIVPAEQIAIELERLSAPLGVIAVLGNHDYWNEETQHVRRHFEAHGIVVLDDEVRRIDTRGSTFAVLGLRDEYQRKRTASEELALAAPGLPLIVLTHEPDIFADLDERATLTLAGHTHGGQVNLPFLGRRVVPSRFGQRFAAGHVVEDGRHLFVTSGIGTSILPVRFRVPPEIALLTLR